MTHFSSYKNEVTLPRKDKLKSHSTLRDIDMIQTANGNNINRSTPVRADAEASIHKNR